MAAWEGGSDYLLGLQGALAKEEAARRDLAQWRVHEIDGNQLSGHQALPTDVDEDGDDDIVLANADFDTPDDREEVVWYENPGNDTEAQRGSWRKRQIYKSPDFTVKPQLGIGDLDDDGHVDLVTQTPKHLLVFRKTSVDPVKFETIKVLKDPAARWTPRTVRVGDFDGDDQLDVMGMLSHENANVPIDKASVYWMEYDGKRPTADNWTTHVVAWGPGRAMATSSLGSKWDQAHLVDVDDDGDPDLFVGLAPGARCVVAVRPENIALGGDGENAVDGTVVLASYLGSVLRYIRQLVSTGTPGDASDGQLLHAFASGAAKRTIQVLEEQAAGIIAEHADGRR